jgi:hypothetical protein
MIADVGQREIYHWYMDLERARGPGSNLIDDVEERIRQESDQRKLRALKLLLATEYAFHGRNVDAEVTHHDLCREWSDDPFPLISLAEQKLHYENKPEAAMAIVDKAIEVALRSGNFRRYALGVKARIGLQLGAHGLVEGVLRQLLQLKFDPGNLDCGIERDFFDRLPAGAIDEELARQFDDYSRLER